MRFAASAAVSTSLLANCAGDLPKRSFVKSDEAVKQREAEWDNKPAIQTVRLPGKFFMSEPLHTAVPAAVGKKQLDITMPGGAATLDDLLVILESQGLSVSYSWESSNNTDDIGARRLPFRRFQGTVSELLQRLQMGMSIASWWNSNTLYLSPLQRYTVKVPQNDEVIGVVEGQLESLGAQDIVSSLYAGQVTYSASPESNAELIAPFLRRLALNMSEITLQVALVRVQMNEAARRGFDWSNFNLAYAKNISSLTSAASAANSSTTGATSTTGTTTATGTNSTTGTTTGDTTTTSVTNAAQYGIGSIIGSTTAGTTTSTGVDTEGSAGVQGLLSSVPGLVAQATVGRLSLTAAIGLLSEFGTTSTDQNVELRTLAGQPVHIRDGGETPYVSQITSNTTISGSGAGNNSNSVEFETVDTGLTLDMTPNFDAGSGIVTVDVSLNVEDIESFLSLPSGTSYGNIERPVTSNRELTDLVRVAAGETVILGGVTKISKTDDRSAPLDLWTIGSDNSETDRVALFIILRPFVTVYELDGNVMGEEQARDTVASAPAPAPRPAPERAGPAARTVQQSFTRPGRPATGSTPTQAPVPAAPTPAAPLNRPTAEAEPDTDPTPSSLAVSKPEPLSVPVQAAYAPAAPARVAVAPSLVASAAAETPVAATPVAATPVSAPAGAAPSGYFNDLVGKILVPAPQQQ